MAQTQQLAAERSLSFEAYAREHLKRTHSPESLKGLSWDHAEKGQPFEYILEFYLRPDKRPNRTPAPCPLCSPHAPKYYYGALVWFPSERVYRCIGRECAGHYIGKAEAETARRNFRATEARNADFEFLFANLGCVPGMIQYFEALLPAALYAERLRHKLGAAHVREALRKVHKNNDGRLTVWDTREVERFDPLTNGIRTAKERVPVSFGNLDGPTVLANTFDVARKIRIETDNLKVLDRGEQNSAERWVLDYAYNHPENMRIACLRLRNANDLQRRAVEKISDVLAFFTEQNFARLRNFCEDRRNTVPLYVSLRNGEFRIGPTLSQCVSIRPDYDILNHLPVWPDLRLPTNV